MTQVEFENQMRELRVQKGVELTVIAKMQGEVKEQIAAIDRKVKELFIMRYVYTTGDMKPAIEYVEGKKNYLLTKAMNRFSISRAYAERLFSEASLIMYGRIESATNSVTELTMTTYGIMGKIRRKLINQREYYERGEKHRLRSTNTVECRWNTRHFV